MKLTYQTLIALSLAKRCVHPGDILTLTICNPDGDEGMFAQAKRLSDMFLSCYNFWPQSIALHPDHLALIKKQGKTLDVTFSNAVSSLLSERINLAELPTRIPLVADPSLDLFTAVARFDFKEEDVADLLAESLIYLLKKED